MTSEAELAALQRKINLVQGVWSLFMLAAIVLLVINWPTPKTLAMRIAWGAAFGGIGVLALIRRSLVMKYQKLGGEQPPKTN